jgi:hypothetical protein
MINRQAREILVAPSTYQIWCFLHGKMCLAAPMINLQ